MYDSSCKVKSSVKRTILNHCIRVLPPPPHEKKNNNARDVFDLNEKYSNFGTRVNVFSLFFCNKVYCAAGVHIRNLILTFCYDFILINNT